jgi:hypothetical protein
VFVVDEKGIAQSRDVKIGGRTDHAAWITDGLKAGEHIVTQGAYGVDDSTKVQTAEDRGSKTEDRGPKTEDGRPKTEEKGDKAPAASKKP